jgi:AcrR family transcriptional regulator
MVTVDPVSLRERKKLKTREALQDAALQLFAEKGFDHTTIEEIVEACEMSPRTFFRYFPNKESVLLGDSDGKCELLVRALSDRPLSESPMRAVRECVLATLDGLEHDREHLLVHSRIIQDTPHLRVYKIERQQTWEDALFDALRARDELDPRSAHSTFELRLIASTSVAAMRAALETWLEEGGDLMELAGDAFDNIAAGLADV